MFGPRILILVPHPDDEVVGVAAAIGRARAENALVYTLYLTTGIPARDDFWPWQRAFQSAKVAQRREEAVAAAELLGVEPVGFCGYAARTLRLDLPAVMSRIEEALRLISPSVLWVPAYEGGHQDHDVASFLGSRLVPRLPVWEFAEYNRARGRLNLQEFPHPTGLERVLVLNDQEMARKQRALSLYRTDRVSLSHIRAKHESLRPIADYDYKRSPHAGMLFYQRFQWSPIRHPRFDFTRPEEVCKAMTDFCTTASR